MQFKSARRVLISGGQEYMADHIVQSVTAIRSFPDKQHDILFYGPTHPLALGFVNLDISVTIEPCRFKISPKYHIASSAYRPHILVEAVERGLNVMTTRDFTTFDEPKTIALKESADSAIVVDSAFRSGDRLVVFYHVAGNQRSDVKVILLNAKKLTQIRTRITKPVWHTPDRWKGKAFRHVGTILINKRFISYWEVDGEGVYAAEYPLSQQLYAAQTPSPTLDKHADNPMISPNADNEWEAFNTFNPAAVELDGETHLIYRAQGFDYVSMLGYAKSADGVAVDYRHPHPVYKPQAEFEFTTQTADTVNQSFMSGGGYGGVEDPRVTYIDGKLHMVYVAFDGVNGPRLAISSIAKNDFTSRKFNKWSPPTLISRPGVVDKSGCVFPRKINGKYAILHRIFPHIYLDYVDDLNFDGNTWLACEYQIPIREEMWDSRKIGAGAPPLWTKDGWLLIYYGVDDRDASKYMVGAMLLDHNDPTKVLYRSDEPILVPDSHFENHGFKPGIAYPCGAVIKNETLYVYYGGADSYVCVATAPLESFLARLKKHSTLEMQTERHVYSFAYDRYQTL